MGYQIGRGVLRGTLTAVGSKPGILGGGRREVYTPPVPSSPRLPVGGIIAFWDGKAFGSWPDVATALENIKSRKWLSNNAWDLDCFEFYEIVGEPAEGPRKGSFSGLFDSEGGRIIHDDEYEYAVKAIPSIITQEVRDALP